MSNRLNRRNYSFCGAGLATGFYPKKVEPLTKGGAKMKKQSYEYIVQGAYGQGWEDVAAEETRKEALATLRAYRENETQYPHRLIKRKIKN